MFTPPVMSEDIFFVNVQAIFDKYIKICKYKNTPYDK